MSTLYQYSLGAGHDLPLGSLTNMELVAGFEVPPRTSPVNPFPVRRQQLGGSSQAQGRLDHVWQFSYVTYQQIQTFINTYLTNSGTVYESRPVTMYTRRHDSGDSVYTRYNAYVHYPIANEDYTLPDTGDKFLDLRVRFTGLEELS